MSLPTTYSLTSRLWPHDGFLQIVDQENNRLVGLSIEFMRKGHVLTWEYVEHTLSACIEEEGAICHVDGTHLNREQPPATGTYLFVRSDDSSLGCSPTIGPRLQYAHRAPRPESEHSTMSASSLTGSSTNQAAFRRALLARDGACLLSDRVRSSVACHILPQSRPEYYSELLGHQPGSYHEVEYGILLQNDLHHSFDQGNWALFPDSRDQFSLIVHVFADVRAKEYHGKVLRRDRFRIDDEIELPRRDFLAFHYRQCAVMHVRGYSHFPSDI